MRLANVQLAHGSHHSVRLRMQSKEPPRIFSPFSLAQNGREILYTRWVSIA